MCRAAADLGYLVAGRRARDERHRRGRSATPMTPRACSVSVLTGSSAPSRCLRSPQNSAGSELSVLTNQTKQALYNLLDKLDTAQYSGITDAAGHLSAGPEPSAGQHRPDGGLLQYHRSAADRVRRHQGTARHAADRHRHNERLFQPHGGLARHRGRICQALADADPATLQKMLADGFPGSGHQPRRADRHGLQLEILRGLRFGYRRTVRRSVHA